MALYEVTFIARQDLTETQAKTLADDMVKIATDNGATVFKNEYCNLRPLTYRIKKNRKGHYIHLCIGGPSVALQEMERQLGLSEDVLRSLTVRVEAFEEGPSVLLASKGDKGDRPARSGRRFDRDGFDDSSEEAA